MANLRALLIDCFCLIDRLSHYSRSVDNPICPFCQSNWNTVGFRHDRDCLITDSILLFSSMKEFLSNFPETDSGEEDE